MRPIAGKEVSSSTAGDRPAQAGLRKTLGIGFGVAVSVGAMVGVGILRAPSLIAGHVPDVLVIAALWLVGGLNALLDANVLAELAVLYPKAGGPYVYARRAIGELGGMIVGWADWLNQTSGIAVLSIGAAEFAGLLAPQLKPHVTVAALALQFAFYAVNIAGVRQGALTQTVTSLLKMVFLFAIMAAIFAAAPATRAAGSAATSWIGAVLAYQLIAGCYSGWNAPAYFAEEKTDPAKQIPRALFVSASLVALLYVLFNLALARALPLGVLRATPLPAAIATQALFGSAAGLVVAAIAILTALSCLNGGIMMGSRVLYGLARDRLFLRWGTGVNRGGSPYAAMLVTAAFSAFIAASNTFETVFQLIGIFTVLVNVSMTASFFVLRWREADAARAWRAWAYPWLPGLALAFDAALFFAFIAVNPRNALYGGGLMLVAVPVWLLLRRRGPSPARSPAPAPWR